jgi:hypothetical protein
MGAWGVGLQASDAALDALGLFERRIRRMPRRGGPVRELLRDVAEKLKEDDVDGVLAVADALLDRGVDLGEAADVARLRLEEALSPSALRDWDAPGERVAALRRFERRLHGERVDVSADNAPPGAPRPARKARAWKAEADALRKDVARRLARYRSSARDLLKEAKRLRPTPGKAMSLLVRAGELWEEGVLDDAGFARLVGLMRGWRFDGPALVAWINAYCLPCTCPLLVPLLSDRSAALRREAVDFLYRFQGKRYAPAIAPRLEDVDPSVRATAILALRAHRAYTAAVEARLGDRDAQVRAAAAEALRVMKR